MGTRRLENLESQNTLGTRDIVATGPLNGLSNSQSQSLESRFGAERRCNMSQGIRISEKGIPTCGGCSRPGSSRREE